jgi:serine/threonine-protein kinase
LADTDDKRFARIKSLFDAALERPAAERDAFLREACGDDPDLFEDVSNLVRAAESETRIGSIVQQVSENVLKERRDPLMQERVGSYRLTELIGEGGMGSVFLAERDDELFQHRVAVKILRPGRADDQLVQRFRSERQLLANLDHTNIAKLLDGGETDSGLPYLVMEYVDGREIDVYCDEEQLTIPERLALFQKVCGAIDYAHRNLVVHRDVKPSNILVGADGEPKLLDFGIAKVLDNSALQLTAAVTQQGRSVMTPEYASPEQVRGEPISTATDVYSLGVLLYKLLCGHMPHRPRGGMPTDLARAIVEDEPSRPSTMLTAPVEASAEESAVGIPESRGTSVARLRILLRGDLDNIVLMALRKEPERRYISARAFHDDLENYLTHRPVVARADSVAYRVSKFVRRHRVGVAISVLVMLLLAGSAIQIVEQRDRARVAAAQSDAVTGFLADLFASASPAGSGGETLTARDLLDEGVREIDGLEDQPRVQARLLQIMGDSYSWIGDYGTSDTLFRRALAILEDRYPDDSAAIGAVLQDLGDNRRIEGDLEGAIGLFEQSAERYRRAFGLEHGRIAYLYGRIGDTRRLQVRFEEAREMLERAIAMKAALGESGDSDDVDIRGNLAIVLDDLGLLTEAAELQTKVVVASRRIDGERHPNTIIRIANLALIQDGQGRFDEALRNADDAHEYMNEVWASNLRSRSWIASVRGSLLRALGRFDEAALSHDEAIRLAIEQAGEDSQLHARRLRGRAGLYIDLGRYRDAEKTLREVLDVATAAGSNPGREAGRAWIQLADVYNRSDRPEAAERAAREAIAQSEHIGRLSTLAGRRALGNSLSRQGRYAEAGPLLEEVVSERAGPGPDEYVSMLGYLLAVSEHYRRAGAPERSLEYAERADRISESISPPGTWLAALGKAELGQVLADLGRDREAARLVTDARADLLRVLDDDDPRIPPPMQSGP